jgi:hypothetical protein
VEGTNPGETPEGAAYYKFKSLCLSFIPNSGNVQPAAGIGYLRTSRVTIPAYVASGPFPDGVLLGVSTSFSRSDLNNAKLSVSLSRAGQQGVIALRSIGSDTSTGNLYIYLEYWGTTSINNAYIDITIEL